jgi:Helix-turn-helix domain
MSFVARKFQALERIAADDRLRRWLPLAVAVKIICRYLNSKKEKAWPGIERLAKDLGTDRRNVRRAIDALVETGWLARKVGGGRKNTNVYRLKGGVSAPVSTSNKQGSIRPETGVDRPGNRGRSAPRNLDEPLNNSGRRRSGDVLTQDAGSEREQSDHPRKPNPSRARPATRPRRRSNFGRPMATGFPPDLQLSDANVEVARESAGWDRRRAEIEFTRFRDWHTERGTLRAGWAGAWRNWCEIGKGIDARKQRSKSGRSPEDAVAGAEAFFNEQRERARYVRKEDPYDDETNE